MKVIKNDWVEIETILLEEKERLRNLPADTKNVPLKSYVQGFLEDKSAEIGDTVTLKTLANRKIRGTLIDPSPKFTHNFGQPIPELLSIGTELKDIMDGEI